MKNKSDCIFCQIATGKAPAHEIWSNKTHMAFLSIFPNTDGFTVVMPKTHHGSYAFEQSDQVLSELIIATKKVANILDNYFKDVNRTGMFFEGFGVDHLHSKLFPMHGTGDLENWSMIESKEKNTFYPKYPGFLCSNDSSRADDEKLSKLAKTIKSSNS
ncbi:MAG: HIT family protein [Patescibacteria group bacterium]